MSADTNIKNIKNEVNYCLDFLNNSSDFLSNGEGLFEIVHEFKDKIDNSHLKKNSFLQKFCLSSLREISLEIKAIYEGNYDRYMDGKFSSENSNNDIIDDFVKIYNKLADFVNKANRLLESFYDICNQKKENENIRSQNESLTSENNELKEDKENLLNIVSNKKVTELYAEVEKENKKYYMLNRFLFFVSIFMTLFFAISYDPLKSLYMNYLDISNNFFKEEVPISIVSGKALVFNSSVLKFVLFKISIIVVGITLTTYFLKLSVYYQNKYEQAKQTKLELLAFPDYISLVSKETAEELRKELALKYFGKELDKSHNEKIGNLVQEQMSSSIELVKATAEIIKSVNPVTKNSDSEKNKVIKSPA